VAGRDTLENLDGLMPLGRDERPRAQRHLDAALDHRRPLRHTHLDERHRPSGRRRNLEPEADPTGSPEKERTVPTAAVVAEGTQSIGAGAAEAVTTFDP